MFRYLTTLIVCRREHRSSLARIPHRYPFIPRVGIRNIINDSLSKAANKL